MADANLGQADTITYLGTDVAGTPIVATDATGSLVRKEHYQQYGAG